MKKEFSRSWNSSVKPAKQRKFRINAPLHIKGKLLSAHLSKELKQKYGKRNLRVRKGDKVKITRGTFAGTIGQVEKVNIQTQKIFITKVEYTKKNGAKEKYPIHVSNVIITELDLSDKKRKEKLSPKNK